MVWVKNADGKSRIPLDPRPVVYEITGETFGTVIAHQAQQRFMISHFITCPERAQFSGKNKEQTNAEKSAS